MAPAQVQDIIREAQENHAADGKKRAYQGHKLGEAGQVTAQPYPYFIPFKNR